MTQAITLPLRRFITKLLPGPRMRAPRRLVRREERLLRTDPAELPALPYDANSIAPLCRQLDLSAIVRGVR